MLLWFFLCVEIAYESRLSMDLKGRILAPISEGKENMSAVDACFSLSYKMVQEVKYQHRHIGSLQRQPHKGRG